jgi:carbonic anhydrase/acetyltransferase-like protein (isoleucine patch superfamily)
LFSLKEKKQPQIPYGMTNKKARTTAKQEQRQKQRRGERRRRIGFMLRSYKGIVPVIPASCYVDVSAQVIGDVVLGEQASVWMNAVIRGDVNSIRIGARSNVQDCAVLHGMRHLYPVIVGEMVTIGHNATVHGCVLEDAVLVGIGSTILNNARIGEGSIIAAGAVIPEQTVIPPNSLVAGVPGKVKKTLGDEDRKMILQYAQNYLDYTAIFLSEMGAESGRR